MLRRTGAVLDSTLQKKGKEEKNRTYAETSGPWLLLPWNCSGPQHSLESGSGGM